MASCVRLALLEFALICMFYVAYHLVHIPEDRLRKEASWEVGENHPIFVWSMGFSGHWTFSAKTRKIPDKLKGLKVNCHPSPRAPSESCLLHLSLHPIC